MNGFLPFNSLTKFVLERLAEDQAVAEATDDDDWKLVGWMAADTPDNMAHIARWDPARVLAEVEAKRRILHDPELARGIIAELWQAHPDFEEGFRP